MHQIRQPVSTANSLCGRWSPRLPHPPARACGLSPDPRSRSARSSIAARVTPTCCHQAWWLLAFLNLPSLRPPSPFRAAASFVASETSLTDLLLNCCSRFLLLARVRSLRFQSSPAFRSPGSNIPSRLSSPPRFHHRNNYVSNTRHTRAAAALTLASFASSTLALCSITRGGRKWDDQSLSTPRAGEPYDPAFLTSGFSCKLF